MNVINPYRFAGGTPFLDETGLGTADAAWSVTRKLRAAYAASAIRVRESAGSTELDIGFTGNQLNTAALLAHVGANNGFITTIYDQSGNTRHLTQATASLQPQIVSSGSLLTGANGKACARFDGSNDRMVASTWTLATPITIFSVLKQITWTGGEYMLDGTTANNMVFMQRTSTPRVSIFTPSTFIDNNDLAVGTASLATLIYNGASSLVQINAGTTTTGTLPAGAPGGVTLGSAGNNTLFANIDLQEMILYPVGKNTTDRTTARANMNAFYVLF